MQLIRTTMAPSQALFVQISYHPGWRALVDGQQRPIRPDGLGLMIIEPGCSGACDVRLVYNGGREMLMARWLSAAALLLMIIWAGYWFGRTVSEKLLSRLPAR